MTTLKVTRQDTLADSHEEGPRRTLLKRRGSALATAAMQHALMYQKDTRALMNRLSRVKDCSNELHESRTRLRATWRC